MNAQQTAQEIAKQIAKELNARGKLRDNIMQVSVPIFTAALTAYGNERLEQAAQRLGEEIIEMPVLRYDEEENDTLRRTVAIVRAMKENKP